MQFREVIGQYKIKDQLIKSVRLNRLSHALLFVGKPGSGHLPLALAFAQYVNCENPTEIDSCGVCGSCVKMFKLVHPDVHFSYPVIRKKPSPSPSLSTDWVNEWRECLLENCYVSLQKWLEKSDAGNKQPNITIQECHDIIRKLNFHSFEEGYKVLIMWLPELLGKQGNSLLKLIEEPPEKTLIMLVTNDEEKILNTIRSRTQRVKIPLIKKVDIENALVQHKGINENDAENIARFAYGNWNGALKLINETDHLFHEWMACFAKQAILGDTVSAISWSEMLASKSKDIQKSWLSYLLKFFREGLRQTYGGVKSEMLTGKELLIWEHLENRIIFEELVAFSQKVNDSIYHLERNANTKIVFLNLALNFEECCSQLKNLKKEKTI